eukprot:scaffold27884_cov65-Phaeocystis_antarctica.AAC.6
MCTPGAISTVGTAATAATKAACIRSITVRRPRRKRALAARAAAAGGNPRDGFRRHGECAPERAAPSHSWCGRQLYHGRPL